MYITQAKEIFYVDGIWIDKLQKSKCGNQLRTVKTPSL